MAANETIGVTFVDFALLAAQKPQEAIEKLRQLSLETRKRLIYDLANRLWPEVFRSLGGAPPPFTDKRGAEKPGNASAVVIDPQNQPTVHPIGSSTESLYLNAANLAFCHCELAMHHLEQLIPAEKVPYVALCAYKDGQRTIDSLSHPLLLYARLVVRKTAIHECLVSPRDMTGSLACVTMLQDAFCDVVQHRESLNDFQRSTLCQMLYEVSCFYFVIDDHESHLAYQQKLLEASQLLSVSLDNNSDLDVSAARLRKMHLVAQHMLSGSRLTFEASQVFSIYNKDPSMSHVLQLMSFFAAARNVHCTSYADVTHLLLDDMKCLSVPLSLKRVMAIEAFKCNRCDTAMVVSMCNSIISGSHTVTGRDGGMWNDLAGFFLQAFYGGKWLTTDLWLALLNIPHIAASKPDFTQCFPVTDQWVEKVHGLYLSLYLHLDDESLKTQMQSHDFFKPLFAKYPLLSITETKLRLGDKIVVNRSASLNASTPETNIFYRELLMSRIQSTEGGYRNKMNELLIGMPNLYLPYIMRSARKLYEENDYFNAECLATVALLTDESIPQMMQVVGHAEQIDYMRRIIVDKEPMIFLDRIDAIISKQQTDKQDETMATESIPGFYDQIIRYYSKVVEMPRLDVTLPILQRIIATEEYLMVDPQYNFRIIQSVISLLEHKLSSSGQILTRESANHLNLLILARMFLAMLPTVRNVFSQPLFSRHQILDISLQDMNTLSSEVVAELRWFGYRLLQLFNEREKLFTKFADASASEGMMVVDTDVDISASRSRDTIIRMFIGVFEARKVHQSDSRLFNLLTSLVGGLMSDPNLSHLRISKRHLGDVSYVAMPSLVSWLKQFRQRNDIHDALLKSLKTGQNEFVSFDESSRTLEVMSPTVNGEDMSLLTDLMQGICTTWRRVEPNKSSIVSLILGDMEFVKLQYSEAKKHYMDYILLMADETPDFCNINRIWSSEYVTRLLSCCMNLQEQPNTLFFSQLTHDVDYTTAMTVLRAIQWSQYKEWRPQMRRHVDLHLAKTSANVTNDSMYMHSAARYFTSIPFGYIWDSRLLDYIITRLKKHHCMGLSDELLKLQQRDELQGLLSVSKCRNPELYFESHETNAVDKFRKWTFVVQYYYLNDLFRDQT